MDKIVPTGTSLEIQWLKLPDSTAGGASSIIICWALRLKSKKCPPQPCYWSCMHPRQHIIKQRHQFADKGLYSQSNGFSSGHVWMWELDHKQGWEPKNWCFWTVVSEKTPESPLNCKDIQVHPKGDQSWVFIGRTDAEAETPILCPPDANSLLIWKDPNAAKDWGQEEKGTTEDEMVGWHHRLNGHEFGWTLGTGDRQGGLACCSSWGQKESDKTEQLNWTEKRNYTNELIYKAETDLQTSRRLF